jgi:hypothetical protein
MSRHAVSAAAALVIPARRRVVDRHAPHQEEGFIDLRSRLQRMTAALPRHVSSRNSAQLRLDERR